MTQTYLFVKIVLDRWYGSIKNFNTLLQSLSDETLLQEIAPGKNRGIYLLGHLIAVHDDMIVLLDLGEKLFPELSEPFIKSPDKAINDIPTIAALKSHWTKQCEIMKAQFDQFTPEEWFKKHTGVSAEDFINEPHRNKLNIVVTRTSHLQYHTGQIALLKP